MRSHFTLVAALCSISFAPSAIAQNLTAHPQDTTQNSSGNMAPFGVWPTGMIAEARTQILVPLDELPGPGAVLVGMELHCAAGSALNYSSLRIAMLPTAATSLSMNFAANLVTTPTEVFPAQAASFPWSGNWVPITFSQPYVHDGVSALLIEVQKVVATYPAGNYPLVTMATSSSPPRTDRPLMVYAFGDPGTGAATATVAAVSADPVSFRLQWLGTPTVRHRSDLGASQNQYSLGGTVEMTVQGDPGELWALAAGTGFLTPSVAIPGIGGLLRLDGAVAFGAGLLSGSGEGTFVLGIPVTPGLVGLYLAYQAATVNPVTGFINLTNGMDHFINP